MNTDLSVAQVAVILKCSIRTVRNLIERGAFPHAFKLDPNSRSRWRIPKADVDQFIKQQRSK